MSTAFAKSPRFVGHSYQVVDLGDWVDVREIAPYFRGDKLLTWLEHHGERNGFVRDRDREGYSADCDMSVFLLEKAAGFRNAFLAHLQRSGFTVADLSESKSVRESQEAIRTGYDLIASPYLEDSLRRVSARPDFLIRAEAAAKLFSDPPPLSEEGYVVLQLRLSRLSLTKKGRAKSDPGLARHRAWLLLCSSALGQAQGHQPNQALLLGRGWQQSIDGENVRGTGCLDKAGIVELGDSTLEEEVGDALQWIRRVRREGADWKLFPAPSEEGLRPNTANRYDFPWHNAKTEIAEKLKDPVLLWNVGADKRDAAVAKGITTYDHPEASAAAFGLKNEERSRVLDALIDMARNPGPDVRPGRVNSARDTWGEAAALEFFVDFETVNSSDDNFDRFPETGGQPLIFMVGCGHIEHGVWKFSNFIADRLTEEAEAKVVGDWMAYMEQTRQRLAPSVRHPICFHWSAAEKNTFKNQYDSFKNRHPEAEYADPNWFDFLEQVVRAEPVVVRGALGFGLKTMAKSMQKIGLIEVIWDEGPSDGLGAMVGAWRAYSRCEGSVQSDPLMQGIAKYNNIDCLAMQQIIDWLRKNR